VGRNSEINIMNLKQAEKLIKTQDWVQISKTSGLPLSFISKYHDKVDWYFISAYQKLSESFIEKHRRKVHWDWITIDQKLSEKFIEKHTNRVNWYNVSAHQKLSENFIRRNYGKLDLRRLYNNDKIPKGIIGYETTDVCGVSEYKYHLTKKQEEIIVPNSPEAIKAICPVCEKEIMSKNKINECSSRKSVFVS